MYYQVVDGNIATRTHHLYDEHFRFMKKNFVSIKQIEQHFDSRRVRNEQTKLNYYKALTTKYINKIDPET